jgi:hypothetical protein
MQWKLSIFLCIPYMFLQIVLLQKVSHELFTFIGIFFILIVHASPYLDIKNFSFWDSLELHLYFRQDTLLQIIFSLRILRDTW